MPMRPTKNYCRRLLNRMERPPKYHQKRHLSQTKPRNRIRVRTVSRGHGQVVVSQNPHCLLHIGCLEDLWMEGRQRPTMSRADLRHPFQVLARRTILPKFPPTNLYPDPHGFRASLPHSPRSHGAHHRRGHLTLDSPRQILHKHAKLQPLLRGLAERPRRLMRLTSLPHWRGRWTREETQLPQSRRSGVTMSSA